MTVVFKNYLLKIVKMLVIDDFCEYYGPSNYVSMRKRGTHCIATELRRPIQMLHNSVGRILNALKLRVANLQSIFALLNFGALEVCPAELCSLQSAPVEFWSNATCALLSHEDMGQNIHKKYIKLVFSLFLKVIFGNQCHFRDPYIQMGLVFKGRFFFVRYFETIMVKCKLGISYSLQQVFVLPH